MPRNDHLRKCQAAMRILMDLYERIEPVTDETERSMFEQLEVFITYASTETAARPARRSPFHHRQTLGPRKP